MKVTIRSGYRIAVPKDVRDELQLEEGSELELTIKNGNIILKPKQILKVTKEPKPKIGVRRIVSNLEEGKNFSNKIYTECRLVIKTKRSYINKFCEECQGKLAYEYGVLDHPCKYINIPERVEVEEPKKEEKPVKSIIKKLSENVKKLDKKLDKKIDTIQKECP